LFIITLVWCGLTVCVQRGAIPPAREFSFPTRMANAVVSCTTYVGQMFYPAKLAAFYPYPAGGWPVLKISMAFMLLLAVSCAVFIWRRKQPCLLVGWLWYLGMLVPVVGLVQVGEQSRADRYTYLPQIGLYLMTTWMLAEFFAGWRHRRLVLGGYATAVLVSLIFCARAQTSYWKDSESLWNHALACVPENSLVHFNLGNALFQKGDVNDAILHYQKVLQINPGDADAHNNLANAQLQIGDVDEAIFHCLQALQINPNCVEAHYNLGSALLQNGDVEQAILHCQRAIQIKPDCAQAYNNLGNALLKKGDVDESVVQYQSALRIDPDLVEAQYNIAVALLQKGDMAAAVVHYQRAMELAQAAGQGNLVAQIKSRLNALKGGTSIQSGK